LLVFQKARSPPAAAAAAASEGTTTREQIGKCPKTSNGEIRSPPQSHSHSLAFELLI